MPENLRALPPLAPVVHARPLVERVERIVAALSGYSAIIQTEAELGLAVSGLLSRAGISFEPEVSLRNEDRIDFLASGVGIELKIDGPTAALVRQLERYASHPDIDALVLVTTRRRLAMIPREMNGKPVATVLMGAL